MFLSIFFLKILKISKLFSLYNCIQEFYFFEVIWGHTGELAHQTFFNNLYFAFYILYHYSTSPLRYIATRILCHSSTRPLGHSANRTPDNAATRLLSHSVNRTPHPHYITVTFNGLTRYINLEKMELQKSSI